MKNRYLYSSLKKNDKKSWKLEKNIYEAFN